MDIYIVTGELDGYGYGDEKYTHSSFKKEIQALEFAIDMASGDVTLGGTNRKYALDSIIKFNTTSLTATKMELELVNGQFELQERKNS